MTVEPVVDAKGKLVSRKGSGIVAVGDRTVGTVLVPHTTRAIVMEP